MIKVIETNLSLDSDNLPVECQSRVIEVESWESYAEEIRNAKTVMRTAAIGGLYGNSIPRSSRVFMIQDDDYHLMAYVFNYNDVKTLKTAYVINEMCVS